MQDRTLTDRTIPAPPNTLCGDGRCQRKVFPEDLFIVRYNTKIFHQACFTVWYGRRVARKLQRKVQSYAGV